MTWTRNLNVTYFEDVGLPTQQKISVMLKILKCYHLDRKRDMQMWLLWTR